MLSTWRDGEIGLPATLRLTIGDTTDIGTCWRRSYQRQIQTKTTKQRAKALCALAGNGRHLPALRGRRARVHATVKHVARRPAAAHPSPPFGWPTDRPLALRTGARS